MNQYQHCPTFPTHTPLNNQPLNCNIDYDVDKQYDNYIVVPTNSKQMTEHFGNSCSGFLIKLVLFVAIIWLIIHFVLKN